MKLLYIIINQATLNTKKSAFFAVLDLCHRIFPSNHRNRGFETTVELGYNVIKGTEYFVSF